MFVGGVSPANHQLPRQRLIGGKQLSGKTQADYDKAVNSNKYGVFTRNLSTGKRETFIADKSAFEMDAASIQGSCLYYHSRKEKSIVEVNLLTGEKHALVNGVSGYVIVGNIIDGKLQYTKDNASNDFEGKNPKPNELFYIDLQTKSGRAITFLSGKYNNPAYILGKYGGYYYINMDAKDDGEYVRLGRIKSEYYWNNDFSKLEALQWMHNSEFTRYFRQSKK